MGNWLGPPHEEIARCGAKTRTGSLCGQFAMKNGRCRYHGGKSTGAKNPQSKHGFYSQVSIEKRTRTKRVIDTTERLIRSINQRFQ